ncbi:8954_t:CDS:1, partial [Acaulospora morrowiae]
CNAKVTDANLLPNSILNITVESGYETDGLGVQALGHFTMRIDGLANEFRFLKNPIWVNGCRCKKCDNIPQTYTSQWYFGTVAPPKGTWFDVWIAIYWECHVSDRSGMYCYSLNVHHRDYVK